MVSRTTNVLDSKCPKSELHISISPYMSKKDCHVLHADTRHACKTKVGKSNHGTPAPICRCLKSYVSTTTYLQIFGYAGMTLIVVWRVARKDGCWIGKSFPLYDRWRLRLTLHGRILFFALEDVGFQLQQHQAMSPHRCVGTMLIPPISQSHFMF